MTAPFRRAWGVGLAIATVALAWTPAQAGAPVALATGVSGETTPSVVLFSEIESGAVLALAPDAEIEFLHYPTCEAVVVRGGRIKFTDERYTVQGGKIADTKRATCPKSVALGGPSQIGGLVLRGGRSAGQLKVQPAPVFVLVGQRAQHFSRIRVSDADRVVLEGDLHGRSFRWPADAAPLEAAKAYTVTLVTADGATTETFTIGAGRSGKSDDVTLIRLD